MPRFHLNQNSPDALQPAVWPPRFDSASSKQQRQIDTPMPLFIRMIAGSLMPMVANDDTGVLAVPFAKHQQQFVRQASTIMARPTYLPKAS